MNWTEAQLAEFRARQQASKGPKRTASLAPRPSKPKVITATTGQVIKLTLPFPPSANKYWRNVNGIMLVSEAAKQFKVAVGKICVIHRIPFLEGDIALRIMVYRPHKRWDLGNCEKVLSDALQGYAFKNDNQIAEIYMRRFDDKLNPRLEIEIKEFR